VPGWMAKFQLSGMERFVVALGLVWFCLVAISSVKAQTGTATQNLKPSWRLLTVEEGRSIVNAAWEPGPPARGTQDCSHLIHEIYKNAGFEYEYESSFELYAGSDNFARVKFPRAGDLIVWQGHVGIVVDPLHHSFFSRVRTGLEEQDYEGPYWKSRGTPRFYRYKVQGGGVLTATKAAESPQLPNIKRQEGTRVVSSDRPSSDPEEYSGSNPLPKTASNRTPSTYGPPVPVEPAELAAAFRVPTSVIVVAGSKPPTREEIAESISELSDAAGHALRTDDPSKAQVPLVIVEQFSVERVYVKRDRGWARLQVDSRVSLSGGTTELKPRRQKVLWELRRTDSGWEAFPPADRTYVPHDVAVKNLAAQLARLTESPEAAAHQEMVLRQESQLANLLSALLSSK